MLRKALAKSCNNVLGQLHLSTGMRGYGYFCRNILPTICGDDRYLDVNIHSKSVFRVDLCDPYWNLLNIDKFKYEPEISALLELLLGENSVFIDCGANQGYWSLYASETLPSENVLAVEASADTFAKLSTHCKINNRDCNLIHGAISSISGEEVEFVTESGNHAGASIVGAKDRASNREMVCERVKTVSIDDLVEENFSNHTGNWVVKIDVEGAEIEAIKGAKRVLQKEAVLIFEDLASVDEKGICEFVLEQPELKLFSIHSSGKLEELKDESSLRTIRGARKSHALNFATCSAQTAGSSWICKNI